MKEKFNLLFLLLLPVMAFGMKGDSEFKKTIAKEFNNGSNMVFSVSNKYGQVIIHTWKQNKIKATIVVTGFGKNAKEAESSANMVNIDEENSNGQIALTTNYSPFGGTGVKLFNWGSRRDSKDYVNIDYEIYVPEDLRRLLIDNNFGDVLTDVLSFPAKMGLNYCTYDIKEAQSSLELNLNYCDKGRVGKADALSVHANYSNLKCDNVGNLTARSNYSEYELGSVGLLDAKCNYDDYKIQKAGKVVVGSNYSDVSIGELQAELNVKLVYGDLKVKSVGSAFKGGNVSLLYADIKLAGIPSRVALQLNINLNQGDLKNDLGMKTESSIKKGSKLTYTGIVAGGSEQSPTLLINGSYSDVTLSAN